MPNTERRNLGAFLRRLFVRLKAIATGVLAASLLSALAYGYGEPMTPLGPANPNEAPTEKVTELSRRLSYYQAGTEELKSNEMRVIALGTGNPQLQRGQASSCWYVELGNGDSLFFDMGTGCTSNLAMLEQPWDRFTKIFITHLHSDHFADIGDLLTSGWQMGRSIPLEVWGPSGPSPELGTKAAMQSLLDVYRWEYTSKKGRGPMYSYAIDTHEFDYSIADVVYDRDGVTVTAFPATHAIDGAVSYSLEWNGLKMTYSGDTTPNRWFLEHSTDADLIVHECSDPIEVLIEQRQWPPEAAWLIATSSHTQPQIAGALFSRLKPRMAVCTHFVNNIWNAQRSYLAVRNTYSGPLAMAEDMMIWNVTPEEIVIRRVIGGPYMHNLTRIDRSPSNEERVDLSDWLQEGRLDMSEEYEEVLEELKPEWRERILERVPEDRLR